MYLQTEGYFHLREDGMAGCSISLSKFMALVLRHKPKEYGLNLDPEGYVKTAELLTVIKREKTFKDITYTDIQNAVTNSSKKRYEISGDNIRAYYGHSIPERIEKKSATPPDILYHGTTAKSVKKIILEGIKPMGRQQVHLSSTQETAILVGKRRTSSPVILSIDSKRANEDGVCFFAGNEDVWLADYIPQKYLEQI